jgi:spore germination cell wall hydrolase CwlJ-like protein
MLEKAKYLVPIIGSVLAVLFVTTVTTHQLKSYADDSQASPITADVRMKELDCLARNIYFESASEPFEGKVAVAQVTMNRVESGQFGDSVCGVVHQKSIIYSKVICQFSWYCESPSTLKIRAPDLYKESYEVAKKVLLEGFRLPSLNNAMYYHADYINPGWRKEKVAKIGRHIFYKG